MRQARIRRIAFAGLFCCASALIGHTVAQACTAFCAVGEGQILVGNNEDWDNPQTKIWFLPAKPGSYGRVYTGFDDMTPQGGMNERGLWFDAFSAPPMKAAAGSDLPRFSHSPIKIKAINSNRVIWPASLFLSSLAAPHTQTSCYTVDEATPPVSPQIVRSHGLCNHLLRF